MEGIQGPKWYLEGMAAYTELRLHGRIRGYYDELTRYIKFVNRYYGIP